MGRMMQLMELTLGAPDFLRIKYPPRRICKKGAKEMTLWLRQDKNKKF